MRLDAVVVDAASETKVAVVVVAAMILDEIVVVVAAVHNVFAVENNLVEVAWCWRVRAGELSN